MNLDLLDFFRRVFSWSKLERLIDQLPRTSRFRCAMADDDELADELFKKYGDKRGSSRPPLVDVDYHASLLMVIASKIDKLTATTVAIQGGKPAQPEPLPWPDSAYDRARRRAEKAHTDSLTAEVYAAMDRWKQHHEGGAHG